jgi:hypothetical protein
VSCDIKSRTQKLINTSESIFRLFKNLPYELRIRIYENAFEDSDPFWYVEQGYYFAEPKEKDDKPEKIDRCAHLYLAGPLLACRYLFEDALPTFRRVTGIDVCYKVYLRQKFRPPENSYCWDGPPFNQHSPSTTGRKNLEYLCLCQTQRLEHLDGKACGHYLAWPGDLINYALVSIDPSPETWVPPKKIPRRSEKKSASPALLKWFDVQKGDVSFQKFQNAWEIANWGGNSRKSNSEELVQQDHLRELKCALQILGVFEGGTTRHVSRFGS